MNATVLDAVQLALSGDASTAGARLLELWTALAADDYFHRCVIAHYLADLQPDAATELYWDQLALQAALAASPASFEDQIPGVTRETFLPSLHLNLASSYERTQDFERATQHAALALASLPSLPSSPSAETTRQAIHRIADRLSRSDLQRSAPTSG